MPDGDPRAILWADSQLVAVGAGGRVLTSPDGDIWSSFDLGSSATLRALTWTGRAWVAVGDSGAVYTSDNGQNWVPCNSGTTTNLQSIAWTGTRLFAVGRTSEGDSIESGILITSMDGKEWDSIPMAQDIVPAAVVWTGRRMVLVGTVSGKDTTLTMVSEDGMEWKEARRDGFRLSSMVWTGEKLAAYGKEWDAAGKVEYSRIYISSDTITWIPTLSTSFATYSAVVYGLCWSGRELIAATETVGGLLNYFYGSFVSRNGTDWSTAPAPVSSAAWTGLQTVGVDVKKRFLSSRTSYLVSSDGKAWSSQYWRPWLHAAAWNRGTYVAAGEAGQVFISKDARTWQARKPATTAGLYDLVSSGDRWVAVGEAGAIVTSVDGNLWTASESGSDKSLKGIAWTGKRFVAVGDSGTILSSADGLKWRLESSGTGRTLVDIVWTGRILVAVGDSGAIFTSASGSGWVLSTTLANTFLTSATFDGHAVVAVGYSVRDETRGLPMIAMSSDGRKWNIRPTVLHDTGDVTEVQLQKISGVRGGLVATGRAGYSDNSYPALMASKDGSAWKDIGFAPAELTAVFWDGAHGLAVGVNGAVFTPP